MNHNMSLGLKRLSPSVVGLFGGILGLLYGYFLTSLDFSGCSCGFSLLQSLLGLPLLAGSLIGLIGCFLYFFAKRAGGILLLVGGILASPLPLFIETGSLPGPVIILSYFGFLIAPSILSGLLLFLGGLLAFPKTRYLIKRWHDEGWLP
jgi:hypothetical protein